jgi:hypothetical protein
MFVTGRKDVFPPFKNIYCFSKESYLVTQTGREKGDLPLRMTRRK